jgi:hypothetical protein
MRQSRISYRPHVETLEDRQVMSLLGGLPSALAGPVVLRVVSDLTAPLQLGNQPRNQPPALNAVESSPSTGILAPVLGSVESLFAALPVTPALPAVNGLLGNLLGSDSGAPLAGLDVLPVNLGVSTHLNLGATNQALDLGPIAQVNLGGNQGSGVNVNLGLGAGPHANSTVGANAPNLLPIVLTVGPNVTSNAATNATVGAALSSGAAASIPLAFLTFAVPDAGRAPNQNPGPVGRADLLDLTPPADGAPAARLNLDGPLAPALPDGNSYLPETSGLLTDAAPFELAAMERALQQYLDQVNDFSENMVGWLSEVGPTPWILMGMAVAGALHELIRRRRHHIDKRRLLASKGGADGLYWLP